MSVVRSEKQGKAAEFTYSRFCIKLRAVNSTQAKNRRLFRWHAELRLFRHTSLSLNGASSAPLSPVPVAQQNTAGPRGSSPNGAQMTATSLHTLKANLSGCEGYYAVYSTLSVCRVGLRPVGGFELTPKPLYMHLLLSAEC